jgi:hypothetical protein
VRVTYPIHPFSGQRAAVVGRIRLRGIDHVLVEGRGGFVRRIPVEWTDLKPAAPCAVVGGRPVLFDATLLVRAVAWMDEKLRQIDPSRESTSTGQRAADTDAAGHRCDERSGRSSRVSNGDHQRRSAKRPSPLGRPNRTARRTGGSAR